MWYIYTGKSSSGPLGCSLQCLAFGLLCQLVTLNWLAWISYGFSFIFAYFWIQSIITSIRNYFKGRKELHIRLQTIQEYEPKMREERQARLEALQEAERKIIEKPQVSLEDIQAIRKLYKIYD